MPPPYQLLSLADDRGRIRFAGHFEGRDVTWDATIERVPANEPQVIHVGEPAGDVWPVTIDLHVGRIDETVLLKTVIMIRQYRALKRGRHRFG